MNTKDPSRNMRKHDKVLGAQQQQQRKQVRRRLHTTRPYKERLLNMAEARREIVTALKFHREAMKQANEEKQKQQLPNQVVPLQPSNFSSFEQDSRFKSRRNHRIYPSCTPKFSNHMENFSYTTLPLVQNSDPCSVAPLLMNENPNFSLPNQTLGLNLSFNTLDPTFSLNNNNSVVYSHASPTPYSSPPIGTSSHSQGEGVSSIESSATEHVNGGLHPAMDDEGMEEIRSLGELYQMELNDTMSLITSAWWFNFLNNIENHEHHVMNNEDDAYHDIDEHIEIPTLGNANESCLELCTEDYFEYPTLSCWYGLAVEI